MTTAQQEANHKTNVTAATVALHAAQSAARAAYNNTPAAWPAYDAAIKAADAANMRAIIASCATNGLADGPRQSLYYLTGSWF